MSAFTARLARFLRWFFDSSPTTPEIEPVPRREPASVRAPGTGAGRERPKRPLDDRSRRVQTSGGFRGEQRRVRKASRARRVDA